MNWKNAFFLLLAILFFSTANFGFAQNRHDIFIAASGNTSMYGADSLAYGGGILVGYGPDNGLAIALKLAYFYGAEDLSVIEFSYIVRYFPFGANKNTGLFLQIMGGPSLVNRFGNFSIPAITGAMTAGFCLGWRFLFNDKWFLEPAARGGYPYMFGAGLSAGVRL